MKNVDAFCNVFKHREEEDETDFRAYIFEIENKSPVYIDKAPRLSISTNSEAAMLSRYT